MLNYRYDELAELLKDVQEPAKSFVLSLLEDFVWLEEKIKELRKYPTYIIDPKDTRRQKKLEVHNMIKDFQAQKNDIATKILRTLENGGISEDSPLLKALAEFNV